MERIPLTSKAIRFVGYDPETQRMEIGFQSGQVYQYEHVAPEHYAELVQAPSAGQHFHQHIKPRYAGKKI